MFNLFVHRDSVYEKKLKEKILTLINLRDSHMTFESWVVVPVFTPQGYHAVSMITRNSIGHMCVISELTVKLCTFSQKY